MTDDLASGRHRGESKQPSWWWMVGVLAMIVVGVWLVSRPVGDLATTTTRAPAAPTTEATAATSTSQPASTTTEAALEPPLIEINRRGGALAIEGVVADQATADALFSTAETVFSRFRLANRLSVGDVATTGGTILLTGEVRAAGAAEMVADAAELAALLGAMVEDQRTVVGRPDGEELTELLNQLAIDEPITFDTASAIITSSGEATLLKALDYFGQYPTVKILVEGHTDEVGDPRANLDLSERRAEAVLDFLIENGISPDRLRARGFGETVPVADNDTEEGRALNRRIEFSIFD